MKFILTSKEYVKAGGEICPYCISPNVHIKNPMRHDDETNAIYKDMVCETCKLEWTDIYKLEKISSSTDVVKYTKNC